MSIDAISSGRSCRRTRNVSVFVIAAASASCPADLCDFTNDSASIIDYYLLFCPSYPESRAAALFLISPLDGSVRALSDKLLDRPRLIERIRSLIMDPDRAHLVPFNTTNREKELLCGSDSHVRRRSEIISAGTKSGCRKIFIEENVPHPLALRTSAAKRTDRRHHADAAKRPSIKQVLAKLNEGVSAKVTLLSI